MDGFSLLLILKANNTPKIKFVTQPGFELLRLTVASRSMTPLVRFPPIGERCGSCHCDSPETSTGDERADRTTSNW